MTAVAAANAYRFTFPDSAQTAAAQETLSLALMAAEALHGEPQVRMDVYCTVDTESRTVWIDTRSVAGADLARMFMGYAMREFPEMVVERVSSPGIPNLGEVADGPK
jgi:pyridoxine/pyridoxamine 5'-phosphate oxidase